MRVIVVDHDSTVLEATVRALREHFVIDAVTNKADCIDLLRQNEFDIVIACERLEDGSGLELLSQIAKRWPETLRVFAADRERLRMLQGRLGPFELFQALSYPINPEKLLATLSLAREARDANADTSNIQHIVLSGEDPTEPATPPPPTSRTARPRTARARTEAALPQIADGGQETEASAPRSIGGRPLSSGRFSRRRSSSRSEPTTAPEVTAGVSVESAAGPARTRRRASRVANAGLPPLGDRPSPATTRESLAEAAEIAAAARARWEPVEERSPASRKAFIAGAGLVAALFVLGLIVLKLGSKVRAVQAPTAAAQPAQPAFSKEVNDRVAEVEADFEQDDFDKAQADIHTLQRLAPDHPRLRFFMSLLERNAKTHRALAAREQQGLAEPEARPPGKRESEGAPGTMSAGTRESAGIARPTPSDTRESAGTAGSGLRGRVAAAAIDAPSASRAQADAGGARPDNEDGPVLVAGAPTSTVPILVPASALPDSSMGTLNAGAAPSSVGTAAGAGTVAGSALAASGSAGAGAGSAAVRATPATAPEVPAAVVPTSGTVARSGPPVATAAISDAPPRPSATLPVVTAEAQLTHRVAPEYPDAALRQGVQGYVDVHFTITPRGTVTDVAVVDARPADVFDRAATEAVRRWRYDPRVVDGRPVESQAQVRLQFKLDPHQAR